MWNEYNLASDWWHHFPPSWSVSLGSKLNKIKHVTLRRWWDDHCEIEHFWQPLDQSSSAGINIKTFHDFIHPLPVIIDDSCRGEHNMITPAVSCSSTDRCLSVCGFLFSLWTFDWELQLTLVTATATSLPLVCVHTLPDTHQTCPHAHYTHPHLPNLHLSSLHSLKFSKVAWESFGFDIK